MDPIALVVIGVVVAGVAWFVLFRDNDTTEFSDPTPAPKPQPTRATGGRKDEPPIPASAKVKPASEKLPTVKTMEGMTKAKLEDLGRKMGVELDRRKTKANMIADLKAGVKK